MLVLHDCATGSWIAILRSGFCFYAIGWNLCGSVCFRLHLGRLAASNISNYLTTGDDCQFNRSMQHLVEKLLPNESIFESMK
jgi:hypothetical protein